jgi:hypothetical protein
MMENINLFKSCKIQSNTVWQEVKAMFCDSLPV